MPRVPLASPATGKLTSSSFIHTTACNFVDTAGRTLLLRGVNLSGSSKAPIDQPSYVLDGFWENGEAGNENFIGQPLNIDDGSADVHLARLRGWGFNMLRFPVTWEALEHAGPGKFDYEFIDYTIRVLRKCKAYGFKVYMDPHQDIWSRFSGGSGAPFWTLTACGIDPRNLTATQSAIIHCEYPLAHIADPASLPAMIWSTNYGRLLSQTLFTLFFAGHDFAPHCVIDGQNIQDYLQDHYIEAFGVLADRIRDAGDLLDDCVIGWDSLNEPFEGLCGWDSLSVTPQRQGSTLKKGSYPTPAQSMRLGMGQAQTVENWSFGSFGPSRDGSVTIDPKGVKIWAEPSIEREDGFHERWGWKRDVSQWKLGSCLWAQHGVWDIETGFILREDYFRHVPSTGEPVEFISDYWRPHFLRYAARIRRAHPEAILFVQPPVFAPPPKLDGDDVLRGRAAYSPHYYDGLTLITRHWNWFNADALGLLRGRYSNTLQAVKIGESAIRKSLQEQLGMLKNDAAILGSYPTIIGEIGTPFDMDKKRSYGWTDKGRYKGDYSRQEKALDASLNGGDGSNGLNWTVWTYCAHSTHDWGDGWNMEDLSLWSADDLPEEDEARQEATLERTLDGDDDPSELYDSSKSGSRAMLLRNHSKMSIVNNHTAPCQSEHSSVTVVDANVASSLTLTTLRSMTVPEKYRTPQRQPCLEDWAADPYGFLTSGGRAVRAFCRPWPTKVIGTPQDMSFDIKKACFKLVVRVSEEDTVVVNEVDKDGDDESEKGKRNATEIFVPLVHFGSEDIVQPHTCKGATRITPSNSREANEYVVSSGRSSAVGSRWPSSVDLPAAVSSGVDTLTKDQEVGFIEKRSLVDVSVKVSGGQWEVEGQTLRWWYDVPKAEEGEVQYSIEIRRKAGVIKPAKVARGVQRKGTWCERFCDEQCRIM
ncbi:hypothetical protein C0993_002689 [Termitomyces sp. T159_Od127]|nr:hypothetical protein C0993_002689 [Termitomyces sp. T159_Od127]